MKHWQKHTAALLLICLVMLLSWNPSQMAAQNPPEVIVSRTAVSKTFALGGNTFAMSVSQVPIHYWTSGSWQDIDNAILPAQSPWNYQMTHDAYTAQFLASFTAGQVVKWTAYNESIAFQPMELQWTNDLNQIQSISMPQNTAVLVTNEAQQTVGTDTGYNQGTIRWDDAYGEGRHFWWTCDTGRLAKVLELENPLPPAADYIINGGNPVARLNFIFSPSRGLSIYVNGNLWDKSTRITTVGLIEFRNGSNQTLWHFQPQRVWDSAGNETIATGELRKSGNNLYISVRVPYSWLQAASYPVFIDPTLSVFASSYDGWVYKDNLTDHYDTWISPTGVAADGIGTYVRFGQSFSTYYRIYRGYFPMPTGDLPDSCTLNSASLYLYGETDNSATEFMMTIQRGSGSRPDPENNGLATSDYDQAFYSDNLGQTDTSTFSISSYNIIAYHAADLGYISKTGLTRIVMRSDRDIDGYEPSGLEYVQVYSSEQTGTSKDPYLYIVYTAAAGNAYSFGYIMGA